MSRLDPATLTWAADEAVRMWNGHEGDDSAWLSGRITADAAGAARFTTFLHSWQVLRTTTANGRIPFLRAFGTTYQPRWVAATAGSKTLYADVSKFAALAATRGWSPQRRTPISAVSKMATMCNPEVFAPWDRFVRQALDARGYLIPANDYAALMAAFDEIRTQHADELDAAARRVAAKLTRPLSPAALALRTLDKYFMREGGLGTPAARQPAPVHTPAPRAATPAPRTTPRVTSGADRARQLVRENAVVEMLESLRFRLSQVIGGVDKCVEYIVAQHPRFYITLNDAVRVDINGLPNGDGAKIHFCTRAPHGRIRQAYDAIMRSPDVAADGSVRNPGSGDPYYVLDAYPGPVNYEDKRVLAAIALFKKVARLR